ncbi:MAG: ABC transporter ATP-binding protein [Nitrospinota bacterium]|jgi:branched-chain amino acid transport system ATP-binding protein|nr:ABC transporter ATP-binding protein [Nitrospinota bacterium]MDP6367733.1 ABC transporter ATP-binding protein [Nitrospinota bacterium]
MLQVEDIHTYYGDSYILQGVSLSVSEGQVVTLLGRNGVGKTTTIRSIVGFTPPRRGHILYRGRDISGRPAYEIARRGIGIVPQGRRIFVSLTVLENLTLGMESSGVWNLGRVYELFPQLGERRHQRAKTLSGGEQSMLAIGRALMTNAELLLMDEPTEGLSPLLVDQVAEAIAQLKKKRQSILLVEQDLSLALEVADYAYILSKGKVVFAGSPKELRQREDIQSQYLGV